MTEARTTAKTAAAAKTAAGAAQHSQPGDGLDYGRRVYRVAGRFLVDARALTVSTICWLLVVALAVFALSTGGAEITAAEVFAALTGRADEFVMMVVVEWRVPRILMAIVVGAALALSGAIFQQLTRNSLGSPDVIGFQTGAYTGALIVMLILHGGSTEITFGALAGGIITALVVFALSTTNTIGLIIVGIAVSAVLMSFNTWLLLNAEIEDAMMARAWGAGNLAGAAWDTTLTAVVFSVVFIIAAVTLVRPLRVNHLGESFAVSLGQRVRVIHVAAVVVGIGLIAVSTALVGPISFIALSAPHIARRLVNGDGLSLGAAAAVGALLLLLADVIAQRIYPPSPLPVGIVTTCIGGVYLLWLLIQEGKKK